MSKFQKCFSLLIISIVFDLLSSFNLPMRLSSLNIISRTRVARPVSLHVCRNMGLNTQAQNINLNKLREKMSEINVKALIVPSDDPHLSEYVCYYVLYFVCILFH